MFFAIFCTFVQLSFYFYGAFKINQFWGEQKGVSGEKVAINGRKILKSWHFYWMVTQNILRTCERKQVFFEKKTKFWDCTRPIRMH